MRRVKHDEAGSAGPGRLNCAECGNPIGLRAGTAPLPPIVGGWEFDYARLCGRPDGLCDLCVRELADEVGKVAAEYMRATLSEFR